MSDFWTRKLAGIATPPQQAPTPQQPGAWWQAPQQPPAQQYPQQPPPAQYVPNGYQQQYPQQWGGLQQQMPGQYPAGPNGMPEEQYIQYLRRVPAEELTQEQMEHIAQWELQNSGKYNQMCPQCGSANFAPAGTKIGTTRLGTDKCFDCGASSSTFTGSPEPAVGGRGSSKAPYRDVRQIDTGGGAGSMYLKFRGVPSGYVPRA